ncbi:MAG: T9SS type A sorting domain-containing protein [Bacteroidales bacterium]|nr:T9SS type A sorting domain-containing protein [Bacteroidales bacterium]
MTPPGYVYATNQTRLINYLNEGGKLYIESVNIGYDYDNTEFFDYLGLMYLNDGTGNEVVTLKGGCYNCTEDLTIYYSGGESPHYSVDRLESNGGQLLFSSEDGYGRTFVNEDQDFRVISSSTIIAAMANGDSLNLKPYFISEYIDYFLGYNPVTTLQENIEKIVNGKSYPNPFDKETRIEFTLNKTTWVTLNIYNVNGQFVKKLLDTELQPGDYKVTWDATDFSGNALENGFYFYNIETEEGTVSEKMILLR